MKVLVTAADGFIGCQVVKSLLTRGHRVVAASNVVPEQNTLGWMEGVEFVVHDLNGQEAFPASALDGVEVAIHLAWPGLPNYTALFHFEKNLPTAYNFVKRLVEAGVSRVLVTGTCFEYGMRDGAIPSGAPTVPANPYSLGKDMLHRQLRALADVHPFALTWVRLFYMYGPGQNPRSLIAQLDTAIDRGDEVFNMSAGEQLRDYLPVEEVGRRIVAYAEWPRGGVFNCCSGKAISVRRLVEQHIAARGSQIKLNLGFYPYSPLEPLAFWGELTTEEEKIMGTASA